MAGKYLHLGHIPVSDSAVSSYCEADSLAREGLIEVSVESVSLLELELVDSPQIFQFVTRCIMNVVASHKLRFFSKYYSS